MAPARLRRFQLLQQFVTVLTAKGQMRLQARQLCVGVLLDEPFAAGHCCKEAAPLFVCEW